MLRFNQYLTEAFDALFNNKDKEPYGEKIFNMLQTAYADIGGIKGTGFKSVEDMIANIPMWKIFRKDGDVRAVVMYKSKGGTGRKRVAMAHDQTLEGSKGLKQMVKDDYSKDRMYGEVSGKAEAYIRKILGSDFDKYKIPVEKVKELLPEDEITPVDDFYYQRDIGGHLETKLMMGNPNAKPVIIDKD